ncbi:MAG: hypothetical protein U0X39_07440 [Bacteroidales bacterium]
MSLNCRGWLTDMGKLALALVFVLNATTSTAQVSTSRVSRQMALDDFNKANYEGALLKFNALASQYPRDPLYKYYRGVCLVNLEKDAALASDLLKESVNGSVTIRAVPADVWYWLGRARQQDGDFRGAVDAYDRFTTEAGKKAAKELKVNDLVQQCNAGIKGMDAKAGIGTKSSEQISASDNKDLPRAVADRPVQTITSDPVPEKLVPGYDRLLGLSVKFRTVADSLASEAAEARKPVTGSDSQKKQEQKVKAERLDKLASAATDSSVHYLNLFRLASGDTTIVKSNEKKVSDPATATIIPVKSQSVEEKKEAGEVKGAGETKETDKVASNLNPVVDVGQTKTVRQDTLVNESVTRVFSVFDLDATRKGNPADKVQINPVVPSGLIYRVQVAVFRNPVAVSYFKGLTPVYGFRQENSEVTIYYAGMFRRAADASKALVKVKSAGFRDAFIVPLMDKKQISMERAGYFEKEWGSKPLYEEKKITRVSNSDTIPPTLVFRVEVTRSSKPLPAAKIEEMRKLAGQRGFDIIVNDSKQNLYIIGKFLTFRSATEYADLLVRNGYKESKVVAYIGKKEIPVETARQLFEQH